MCYHGTRLSVVSCICVISQINNFGETGTRCKPAIRRHEQDMIRHYSADMDSD